MADKTLKATLIADDKMSAVFKKAGDSAKTLGDSLSEAGDAGQAAAKDLDSAGMSADEFGRRIALAEQAGRQLSVGLIGIASLSAVAGHAFRDQQNELATLERNYGSASDQMQEFAQHLQDTTNYSNDAAVAAANTAATLARNYGFTADEIQRVLTISADLAASSGLGLEDTTQRVVAALRGEAEAAEVLGLTMNQQAIDRNNLTLSMDNQAAGHYRLNALIQQSAFAEGAAAQQADSSYGAMTRLAHGVQDLMQSYGGALGVIGEFGALIADHPKQALAATAALKSMEIGIKGVVSAYQALKGINLASALAGGVGALPGVSALIGLLTGPGGLIVAGAAAAAGVIYLASTLSEKYTPTAQEAIASSGELAAAIREVGASSLDSAALGTQWSGKLDEIATRSDNLTARAAELQAQISATWGDQYLNLRPLSSDLTAVTMAAYGQASVLQELAGQYAVVPEDAARFGAAETALAQVIRDGGQGRELAVQTVNALFAAYDRGDVTLSQLLDALIAVGNGLDDFDNKALNASLAAMTLDERVKKATQSTKGWLDAGGRFHEWLDDDLTKSLHDVGQASVELGPLLQEPWRDNPFILRYIKQLDDVQTSMTEMGRLSTRMGAPGDDGSFDVQIQKTKAAAAEHAEVQRGLAQGIRTAADAMTYQIGESQRLADAIAADDRAIAKLNEAAKTTWNQMAQSAQAPLEAMQAGYRIAIQNTDAIKQQSQQVADWSENMIKARGEWSRLDELTQQGRIQGQSGVFDDGSEYANIQNAYDAIQLYNEAIQDNVDVVQLKQAPALAEMEKNLQDYTASLADATPEQQMFALAMMDSATASQAFDIATGLIENRDVFGPMAESLANLNPYLGEALVQMGLMDKVYNDSTGTYEYHLKVDGAEDALSQTQQLTQAIEALNKTFTIALGIEVDTGPLDNLRDKLNPFGGGSDTTGTGISIAVTADASSATQTIADVVGTEIPDKTLDILGDPAGANTAIGDVNGATVDPKTLTIGGDNDAAMTAIQTVNNTPVYDKTMTINVVTAYSTIGTPSVGARHGGIPGYARGGVVAELAEAGPEVLHFANGGVATVWDHGVYDIPRGTYVSPNNTGSHGGYTVHVDFSGAQFNGTSQADMDDWAKTTFIPLVLRAIEDERRGQVS